MRYISTRGHAPALRFDEALLSGLAPDGGLYVPETLPQFSMADISAMQSLTYQELAVAILTPFVGEVFDEATLTRMVENAYAPFTHAAIAPLTQIGHQHFVLELFHGPTLAFKDFALQLLGQMMEEALKNTKEKALVLGATSGDTGSAAIHGLKGKAHMDIVILYPDGRPSNVQRRQMTTLADENVHALAINGSFDDCQDLVKRCFSDKAFREKRPLLAVNSINIARVLAQVIYYFYAACALGAPATKVRFTVPTGNFGDIYAGYLAKKMGLPVEKLVIATNENDILARALRDGHYHTTKVAQTLSPSMDIQLASNFERLLFDLYTRDSARLQDALQSLKQTGKLDISGTMLKDFQADFAAQSVDDAATLAQMRSTYAESGYLLDPHSAIGVRASVLEQQARPIHTPTITLATAHPAKFPDAVKQATNQTPPLPEALQNMMQTPERITKLEANLEVLKGYLEG